MKYKLFLIIIGATIITFLIYHYCYHFQANITSINSLSTQNNYNEQLSNILSTNNKYKFNIDYSSPDLEIENLIALIQNNNHSIQNTIHNSEVIIISIGNVDMKTESTKTILKEYSYLFKLIRKYNNKEIIFLCPITFKNITELKDLCHTNNIIFINTSSYIIDSTPDMLTPKESKIIANAIIKKISI